MICVIRIVGQVGLNRKVAETLDRLRLKRKYACIVINPSREQSGMIKKMRSFIAYGEISDAVFEKLIEKRAHLIDKSKKKLDAKKILEELKNGKRYEDLNVKPFFRLHPARGGIETKIHFPKGVLGEHGKEINKLVERML